MASPSTGMGKEKKTANTNNVNIEKGVTAAIQHLGSLSLTLFSVHGLEFGTKPFPTKKKNGTNETRPKYRVEIP